MEELFRLVSVKDRMPNFDERILFVNKRYEKGFYKEYLPNQEVEIKKGKFIQLKDCPRAIEILKSSFTHWLEAI